MDVLAAFVAAGGSVAGAAKLVGIRPSTAKRHLADLRARSGLTTEQLIYAGRASGTAHRAELGASLSGSRSGLFAVFAPTPGSTGSILGSFNGTVEWSRALD